VNFVRCPGQPAHLFGGQYTDDPLDRLEKIVVALTSDIAESAKEGNHSMHDDSVSSSLMMTLMWMRRGEAYLACAQIH
jgi:hypothetical protein